MFKRIDHVEIVTPDMNRSISFYTDVLGFRVLERRKVEMPEVDEISFLQLNDSKLELLSAKSPASLSGMPWQIGYRSMAIEVEDMDKAVTYLKSKGVEITWGPRALGKSRRAEIKDPTGLSIELRQW